MSKPLDPRQYTSVKGGLVRDFNGDWLMAAGTTVPTDGAAGYARDCLFWDSDAAAGARLYKNEGDPASAAFALVTGVVLGGLAATAAEINRAAKNSTRAVAAGAASLTATQALHDGKTVLLDQATGTAVALPAASGSGMRLRFFVSVTKSGGSDVITATGAFLFGSLDLGDDTGVGTLFTDRVANSAGGSTTITLDGTTKGGRKGDWIELEDVATNTWAVRGHLNASGTEATPFA